MSTWKKIGKAVGKAVKDFGKVVAAPTEYMLEGMAKASEPILQAAGYAWNELNGTNAMLKSAELQNEYNLKYWQMQNEYNTPAAQMQRFIDAGLNPNLAYSLSNTAGDVGRVSVGTPDSALGVASKAISAISAWQGIKNMRLQNENLAYQTEFTKLQNRQMLQNIRRAKFENDWMERAGVPSFGGIFDKGFGAVRYHGLELLDWLYNNIEKVNFDSVRKN